MSNKSFISKILVNPLQRIVNDSRSVGIILFACSIVSICVANISFGKQYIDFWNSSFIYLIIFIYHIRCCTGSMMALWLFSFSLLAWKSKESFYRRAIFLTTISYAPVCTIGGMIVPAILYMFFNKNTAFQHGWGIPMATDIAFSLGILSMLGKKVPLPLKVFLTALAIIDDLGAILVIALFMALP